MKLTSVTGLRKLKAVDAKSPVH